MADFSALKTSIQNYIKQNGNEEITGNLLQQVLLSMVTTLGDSAINDLVTALNNEVTARQNADGTLQGNINTLQGNINTLQGVVNGIIANIDNGYVYAGIANPSTTPASGKVFYLALTAGTYTNFGATVVPQGINILKYNGSAWSLDSFLGLDNAPTQGSNNLVKSGGVLDSIIKDGSAFDLSAYNSGTTYADLSAALTALNALPAAYKKGGMSMKFVQSSDNKYIQYRYMGTATTGSPNPFLDTANWQGVDATPTAGSNNVCKSGSVAAVESTKYIKISGNLIDPDRCIIGKFLDKITGEERNAIAPWFISNYIAVCGKNLSFDAYHSSTGSIASYVVYDNNLNIIRVVSESQHYTYQDGDYAIRINSNGSVEGKMANYGDTLLPYVQYDDIGIERLSEEVNQISEEVSILEGSKLDKIPSTNLINPSELQAKKFINTVGNIGTSSANNYCVSGYIRVIDKNGVGQDIKSNAVVSSIAGSFIVYDKDKVKLRYSVNTTDQYTYQEGDYYVIFGFNKNASDITNILANYGNTLLEYTPYSQYKPLTDLEVRVDNIEDAIGMDKENLSLSSINNIYQVWNSVLQSRQYISKIWLSHLISDSSYTNKEIFFDNGLRCYPFYPISVNRKSESNITINITPHKGYNDTTLVLKNRITDSAASKAIAPRILTIGDSVTNGTGASANKDVSWLPNQYWAYAKMFFEMDKIDGGDNINEYNSIFIGYAPSGTFTINYNGISRSVRCGAASRGGAKLSDLFSPTWSGAENPFYDETNQTFSIVSYLERYRTMDDLGIRLVSNSADPHGESVIGSDGRTYTIGNYITSQALLSYYDVCTPTHVFINMNNNSSLAEFQTYISQFVNIIKTELDIPVVIMVIDETGTYFPIDYPNQQPSTLNIGNLHTKNLSIYEYCKDNIEDEANEVYLLGANFIQPTARSYPTIKYQSSDSVEKIEKEPDYLVADPSVVGGNIHPNNYAHAAWGYSMYAMIKWLITPNT